jgi:hypothetical protein
MYIKHWAFVTNWVSYEGLFLPLWCVRLLEKCSNLSLPWEVLNCLTL